MSWWGEWNSDPRRRLDSCERGAESQFEIRQMIDRFHPASLCRILN